MDSILPMGGFQLPFQRRLSRLYNDTKKSGDFVKEPAQHEDDPEIKALYRKLRIQKDRFVSWGLEWSDPNQSAEIDESLSKAGLSEVVGSIMSTIKDILAEAEPLWMSYKRVVEGVRPSPDRKAPLVQWDKTRFEDLIRDLTASIDTLYDLSRMRSTEVSNPQVTKSAIKTAASEGEFRPFESTRMQTPQQIDHKSLTHLQPLEDGLSTISASCRHVVYMSKTAYSELTTQGLTRQPWAPLLLEYANFDPIYSTTGIMPPMTRFEKLSAALQQNPQRAPGAWTGLPRLLGYFEDLENSRLGLVYLFPPSFNTLASNRVSQNPQYSLPTLSDLLARGGSEPPLEAKFRFAYNLTNTVFDLHARGITHGNLCDANISFSRAAAADHGGKDAQVDVRRPVLSSFDVFTEEDSTECSIWRHPLDPRAAQTSPLPKSTDKRVLEVYSLAMVLLSIGLWTKLESLAPAAAPTTVPEGVLDTLAIRCGTLYMKAVQACWKVVDEELSGSPKGESLLSAVQMRVTRFLEACCILDGVSGFEERLGQEPSPVEPAPLSTAGPSKDGKAKKALPGPVAPAAPAKKPLPPSAPAHIPASANETNEPEAKESKSEAKVRLYPHVPLPPDVVEKWNAILMPQINIALKSFYRKHPESVEISLESVGPSPHQTRPTVLVVCTSVGKVRAILKKKLSELFDDSTGFGLKVCRGSVIRSRRQAGAVQRSMARGSRSGGNAGHDGDDDHVEAVNPEYQERPHNGASIGAWIGDRHLPPVSFGGLVIVDDKTYGMTVHHMLDDPDRDFGVPDTMRSSAIPGREWLPESSSGSFDGEDFSYELSDTESEPYSETDLTSDFEDEEDDEEDEEYNEPGDIPGIEPGCGDGYIVTQPALDDVEEGFYPCAETEDEDHLDTYSLGEVYASSGIRRKQANGLLHEVDWALFEFTDGRLPDDNYIPRISDLGQQSRKSSKSSQPPLRPTTVAPWAALPGLEVQCVARTSGQQTGQILPALTSVKIYGRQSPSHTYQIASTPPPATGSTAKGSSIPLGIPGDSGAWIVDRYQGQLCGHVLAWSQRKHVAYMCPMDVLLLDIAQTLEATEVRLPGGEPVVMLNTEELDSTREVEEEDDWEAEEEEEEEREEEEYDMPPALAGEPSSPKRIPTPATSSSPIIMDVAEMPGLTSKMESMKVGTRRINVNG